MALNYQTNDPSQGSAFNWGSLISPTIGAVGSYIGGQQSKNGIDAANQQQQQIYNQVAGIYQPQYATGMGADKGLASALGLNGAAPNYAAFENSPGYQFTLQQGDQAINRAAASTGNAYNSSTIAALDKYNTGLAQQTYQNYVGNLLSTAGLGNQAAAGMASARYNTGANIGQGLQNIGGINQSGVNSAFSQFAGPLGNLAKNYFMSGSGGGGGAAGAAGSAFGDYSGITAADGTPYFLDAGSSAASGAGDLAASGVPDWLGGFSSAGGQAAAAGTADAGANASAAAAGGSLGLGLAGAALPIGLALYGASQPPWTYNSDHYKQLNQAIAAGPGQFASTQGFNGTSWDPQYMNYMAAQQALNGTDWQQLVSSGQVPFAPIAGGNSGPQVTGNR